MTVYADYSYYADTYGGVFFKTEEAFAPCAARASLYIDDLTMERAAACADLDRVKLACCAIAEQVQIIREAEAASLSGSDRMKSQTVGSFSVSYRTSDEIKTSATAEINNLARLYLGPTGLLYRGVRRLWD